jgi:signal transduction histidine kinase
LRLLEEKGADCVILDYRLGPYCGLETLRAIRERGDDTAIVLVAGLGTEMVAVEALQRGAQDYLAKSALAPEVLQRAITNAVEKVALGRQLVQKQRELEDFVSVVAHDLQQPLCAVKGNIELIRDFYAASLDGQGLEFVDAAIRTSARMAEMIDALLGYARAGRDRSPVEDLDLNRILAGVQDDLAELIARSGAEVKVEELPRVGGDPVTIAQMFQNLISNAIKFRGAEAPKITIGGGKVEDRATLWVRDNGMGIPAESLAAVFVPFRRLAQSKERPGSGIGLATCKKIADQHHGRISVESEVGRGSTFFISMAASAREAPAGVPPGARVLVVDSEPRASYDLGRLLERRGLRAQPAVGATEAVNMLDREHFDAVVLDLALGDGDGLDLVRYVRQHSPTTAVLAVTAGNGLSGPGPLLAEARRQGADHVLPKPLDAAQVASLLQRMVAEARTTSPAA